MFQFIFFYSGILFWSVVVIGIFFYHIIKNDKDRYKYYESESDYYRETNKVENEYHNKIVRDIYNKLEKKDVLVCDEVDEPGLITSN